MTLVRGVTGANAAHGTSSCGSWRTVIADSPLAYPPTPMGEHLVTGLRHFGSLRVCYDERGEVTSSAPHQTPQPTGLSEGVHTGGAGGNTRYGPAPECRIRV